MSPAAPPNWPVTPSTGSVLAAAGPILVLAAASENLAIL
ncbi:hypothetical protein U716_02555 [Rhodobacter capsulatus B6]|nr:hypothetical protein U716_02555 [Rhodobacter capsulatus B6]